MPYLIGAVIVALGLTMLVAGAQGAGGNLFAALTGKTAGSKAQPKVSTSLGPFSGASGAIAYGNPGSVSPLMPGSMPSGTVLSA